MSMATNDNFSTHVEVDDALNNRGEERMLQPSLTQHFKTLGRRFDTYIPTIRHQSVLWLLGLLLSISTFSVFSFNQKNTVSNTLSIATHDKQSSQQWHYDKTGKAILSKVSTTLSSDLSLFTPLLIMKAKTPNNVWAATQAVELRDLAALRHDVKTLSEQMVLLAHRQRVAFSPSDDDSRAGSASRSDSSLIRHTSPDHLDDITSINQGSEVFSKQAKRLPETK